MIDLHTVHTILAEAGAMAHRMHGMDYEDSRAISDQSRGAARKARAELSQDLNLLADRLELAAALVRQEYWAGRGVRRSVHRR